MDDILKPGQNTGVIVAPSDADWKAGAETGSFVPVLSSGDWRPWMPAGERQIAVVNNRTYLETDACMTFAALDTLEGLFNYLLGQKLVPQRHLEFLDQNGYTDTDGRVNFSDRFTAKMSGTTEDTGNSYNGVYGSIRADGLIPEDDWAFPVKQIAGLPTDAQRWAEYYADIPADRISKGRQFLKYFLINYDLVRYPGSVGALAPWMTYSPLHILTGVCPPWNTANILKACDLPVQHATALTCVEGGQLDILDHYVPFEKRFATDYPIPWAVRVRVSFLNPSDAPAPFEYSYQTNLRYGAPEGPEVHALQQGLQAARDALGTPFMTAGTFGPFGPLTKAALGAFQTSQRIKDEDGQGMNFGPRSRAALTATLLAQASGVSTPLPVSSKEGATIDVGPSADPTMQDSPKYSLTATDLWKTLRGAIITLAAAALTGVIGYVGAHYDAWSYQVCLQGVPCFDTAFFAIPVIGALLELGRRWLAGRAA